MKHIVGAFSMLLILMLNLLLCASVLAVSAKSAAAKEFKAAVVAEIENSNFNPKVIEACKEQAAACGYRLEVTTAVYDARQDICTAEVVLCYQYELPLLGIAGERITRGVAR